MTEEELEKKFNAFMTEVIVSADALRRTGNPDLSAVIVENLASWMGAAVAIFCDHDSRKIDEVLEGCHDHALQEAADISNKAAALKEKLGRRQ